ncbi:IS256 family transposase [Enterocloster clostridioformis]|uniref:IS256 family transposase n=1 Tax=uncultured Faecalibaculum sp. TaxID=1729681 RepID=UPI0023C64526|nr:IS256 family transposase [Enterocloster clostridioformis]MDE6974808.1 IS256 family transposase [Lachnospiraceae bacterium]
MASRKKKEDTAGAAIARKIMEEYQPKNTEDMQDALKDIFGPMFEAMLQGEMDAHLGYASNDHGRKNTTNRRNGYAHKNVKTAYGDVTIDMPRDREASFTPQIVPKRTRDISGIEDKVLSMYAKGMSQRDIAETIEDIYGFEISHETVSNITDRVMGQAEEWQDRPLKKFYTFLFVDCLYVSIRQEMETKNCAVYVILGYDVDGVKDILGIWIGETEGKHYWMQIFDEIKARGVEDVLFISMDGVSGLEEGAKSIFKDVVVQRCIVHLIRNSIKYIPSKEYKNFTAQLKKVYGAPGLKAAKAEFERFRQSWSRYPGAVDVWVRNWKYVEQLFNYGSAVRKVLYTTNAIEAVNSSFRKVTKKGSFPNEDAVRKALYLRVVELYKKWNGRPVANWALVRNQLAMDDKIQSRILKYENY